MNSMDDIHIRSPYCTPTALNKDFAPSPRSISFLHPAIPPDEGNELFILDGYDTLSGFLHHETARLACAIVAGNQWHGYLAMSPTGPEIDIPPHGLLADGEYYFIVPQPQTARPEHRVTTTDPTEIHQQTQTPYLYPVVPTFREWVFPTELPGSWQSLTKRRSPFIIASTSEAPRTRVQTCRMTEEPEETDLAHIVPLAEEAWFMRNRMARYGNKHISSRPGINDDANIMLLRADLHRSFDKRRFTFLPKKGVMVTHVFESEFLRDKYHNAELNKTYIAPQYFFARFAWTILPLLKPFLQWSPQGRLLLLRGQTHWATPDQCYTFAVPSKDPKDNTGNLSPEKPSPRKGGSSRGSPTKPGSPSKRSRQEIEMEMGAIALDDKPEFQADDQDPQQASPKKRARQGITLLGTGTAPVLNPAQLGPSALPDGGEAQWLQANNRSLPLAPSHSLPNFPAHYHDEHESSPEEDEPSGSEMLNSSPPPSSENKHHQWMPWRKLRKMVSLHLRNERVRTDTTHWEAEQAWYDGILRNGGALDSSQIERWRYSRGEDDSEYCAMPLDD